MKSIYCLIEWCDRKTHAKGFCGGHYKRWISGSDMDKPFLAMSATPEDAFKSRTQWQGDCLVWTGGRNPGGYGNIKIRKGGKLVNGYAHRYAWERVNGPIPNGGHIDHTCFNRLCANVDHLRLVTQAENNQNREGAQSRNATGLRGVRQVPSGRFNAYATSGYKQYSFGTYDTKEEAALAAKDGRDSLFTHSLR